MNKLFTYSLPRPFLGMKIPIPVQSAYLRDYCARNGYEFTLPLVEICKNNCYFLLIRALESGKGVNNSIGLTSILMLPGNDPDLLDVIIKKDLSIKWHFPLENIVLKGEEIINWYEQFNYLKSVARL